MHRLGGAAFIDPLACGLRVDGGAAGVKEGGSGAIREKIFRAIEIDAAVALRSAAAGTGAMDDGIGLRRSSLH